MSNMPHNKNLDSDPMHNCIKCFINAQGCIGSIKTGGGEEKRLRYAAWLWYNASVLELTLEILLN